MNMISNRFAHTANSFNSVHKHTHDIENKGRALTSNYAKQADGAYIILNISFLEDNYDRARPHAPTENRSTIALITYAVKALPFAPAQNTHMLAARCVLGYARSFRPPHQTGPSSPIQRSSSSTPHYSPKVDAHARTTIAEASSSSQCKATYAREQ